MLHTRLPLFKNYLFGLAIQKYTSVLEESVCVLGLRCMAGVRIHDELSVWNVLYHDERVDRRDDDVLGPMYDERGVLNLC